MNPSVIYSNCLNYLSFIFMAGNKIRTPPVIFVKDDKKDVDFAMLREPQ